MPTTHQVLAIKLIRQIESLRTTETLTEGTR